jgi:hypothetical protein
MPKKRETTLVPFYRDRVVRTNGGYGRHGDALLVYSDLALPGVLHDPVPAVVDVSGLAADCCRSVVADDVARLAGGGVEFVESESDIELTRQPASVPG